MESGSAETENKPEKQEESGEEKNPFFKYRWCRQAGEMPNSKLTSTQNIEGAESYNLIIKTTFED